MYKCTRFPFPLQGISIEYIDKIEKFSVLIDLANKEFCLDN